MQQLVKVHHFLRKYLPNPQYVSTVIAGLILLCVGGVFYLHQNPSILKNITPANSELSLKQLSTEQDFFNLATEFQQTLKSYRQEYNQYPNTYQRANIDPQKFGEQFTSDVITYEPQGGDYNYEVCIKVPVTYNEPCFTKFTFLVDPQLAPANKEELSHEQLQISQNHVIDIMYNYDLSDEGATALLTKMYLSDPESAEFATAYAWYRFHTGYIKNNEYLYDDWDIAKEYLKRAGEKQSFTLPQLRLRLMMSGLVYDSGTVESLVDTLQQKYPDSDWTKFFVADTTPNLATKLTSLKKLATDTTDKQVKWDSYWALLGACECVGRDAERLAALDAMLTEFGPHPWIYQHQGNYFLGKKKYEEAISAYLKARDAGDISILHLNLAQAYEEYGYDYFYLRQNDFDQALKYLHKGLDELSVDDTPTRLRIYSDLIEVYRERGFARQQPADLRTALEYSEKLIELDPNHPPIYDQEKTYMEEDLAKMEAKIN